MAKHKYIETPEKLYDLFTQYKEWVSQNPIKVHDFVGKDAEEVYRLKERPYTMVGFECFVMDNTNITHPDLTIYFENKNESYKDFFPISTRIKSEIQNNQVSGGMVGIFNPSLTARLNGIKEQTESNITVTENKVTIE
jgi:hypothetical protein